MLRKGISSLVMGCLLASQGLAGALKEEPVEDFGLLDHQGAFRQLSYHWKDDQTKAIVLFSHGVGCPLVRKRYQQLHTLAASYAPKGVSFWLLNANAQDAYQDLQREAEDFEVTLPILDDDTQEVARRLGIERTAEAIVIDTETLRMVYRGPVDDRLGYESEKPEATRHYLVEALEAHLSGKEPNTPEASGPGCQIHFGAWEKHQQQPIDYRSEIAPLIQEKCVRCHTDGGIAPFAFTSHQKLEGWSDMMQEVLLTQRMPPWQADPHHGTFRDDLSLSAEQKQTLLHWIALGAPRGGGEDPLATSLRLQARLASGRTRSHCGHSHAVGPRRRNH